MAEQKILISIQVKDDGSPKLKKVEGALKGVSDETKKLNQHEKEREALQQRIIKATSKEAVELKQLELRLQLANKRTTEAAKAAINAAEGQDVFAKSVGGTTKGLKKNRAQSGLNNAILIEMGRTASDAQYGFQGMSNNIGRLIELGQEFTRTGAGGLKGSLKTLGKSILGGGGILIGIQLLISFLPTLQKKFKEANNKGVKEFNEELNKTNAILRAVRQEYQKTIDVLTEPTDKKLGIPELPEDFTSEQLQEIVNILNETDSQFKKMFETLTEYDDKTVNQLIKDFNVINSSTKDISELQKEYNKLLNDDKLTQEDRRRIFSEIKREQQEIIDIQKKYFELDLTDKIFDDFEQAAVDRVGGLKFSDVFFVEEDFDPDNIPFFDDMEEAVDEWLLSRGRFDLSKMLLGLTPASREKDIEALEQKFDPILYKTDEYRSAIQAINDKWDAIEVGNKRKVYQQSLNQLSGFLKSAADLNEGNKELARLSIIASSASAAIGIWDTWWNKDKTPAIGKAPLAIAGTAISYAALLASTASALKSVNTGKPLSGGGGGAGSGRTIQAPDFNIVGASQTSQLAETVAAQQSKPVKAFVVGKDISTQQELDRNITNTASFG